MRVSKDSEERKQELIDTAEKLFSEKGIANTAISAIVKELNVAQGLFYYYFKSKDDVIEAISKKYNDEFKRKIMNDISSDDFEKDFEQFIINVTKAFDEMLQKLDDEKLLPISYKSLESCKKEASEKLEAIFQEGIDEDKLNIKDPSRYADVIISGISDLIAKGINSVDEISEIVDELLENKRK
ncbi:MAG: TetR/AcrR family transcriptional regulator [Erysipelotrichaceae bacterium]|nr:TetR/AcrR family transcriptional regulator [Erysipelotrichaceae bacterium]